jgi:hypothetical protein
MTKIEQEGLAKTLASSFAKEYLQMAAKAPENWTGYELRQLLVDCAKERFAFDMDKAQMRGYINDRLTISGL